MVTLETIKSHPKVEAYIQLANEHLGVLGFTEHGTRHTGLVADLARRILLELDYPVRDAELAAIAGYLHDIGNVIGRAGHDRTGALIAMSLLDSLQMPPRDVARVVAAIGNHDEKEGQVVNTIAAALILADKSDAHRSRVRNRDVSTFDIHDRVNYAVVRSELQIEPEQRTISLLLEIDTEISQVMEYFEIFLNRMVMCRRAAAFLDTRFSLMINEVRLL